MTKKLVWRLGKLPSVSELTQLVHDKIITQEEAREILFNHDTEEERDKKSLEAEIKFLRELVEKLSQKPTEIIEKIRYIEKPYIQWDWYKPYKYWNDNIVYCASTNGANSLTNFSSIKTF